MSKVEELRVVVQMGFETEMPTVYHNTILPLLEAALAEARVEGEIAGLEWVQDLYMVRTKYDDVELECAVRIAQLKGVK